MGVTGKAESKYLGRYAEPESSLADALGFFGHAVVIPAFGEGDELFEALESIPAGPSGDVLVVVVVNGKASAPPWVHERNRSLLPKLRQTFGGVGERELSRAVPAWLLPFQVGKLLCIDCSAPPHEFPEDQGVGLARKIGVDLCARLHVGGRLASPFVHCTDADVQLPSDYFERSEFERALRTQRPAAAQLYPFTHRPEPDPWLARAVLLYEIALRYYVLGLAFAGSRYAYHTIGSTIAVHAGAYVRVRGFPKRDAAEDFYLLSKLAKVGPIAVMAGHPIILRGRASTRVPFGTGPAVGRIAADLERRVPFGLYDPVIFRYLRAWLSALARFDTAGPELPERGRAELELEQRVQVACADDGLDHARLFAAAREIGAPLAIASARGQSSELAAVQRHIDTWFDAFRTLKLVHALQRGGLVPRAWKEALCEAAFIPGARGEKKSGNEGESVGEPPHLRELSDRLAAAEAEVRSGLGSVRNPPLPGRKESEFERASARRR